MSLLKNIVIDIPTDEEIEENSLRRFKNAESNKNQFSFWFPYLLDLGINVPKTLTFPLSKEASDIAMREGLSDEMVDNDPLLLQLTAQIKSCFEQFGTDSLFLKNSLFSAKHSWENSCFITHESDINKQLMNILYQWACNSPDYANEIVVREFIETKPAFYAFFGAMPITEEYRFFSKDGETYAYQPYWPKLSIKDPSCSDWEQKLADISTPSAELVKVLSDIAGNVTQKIKGDWSVDFLIDKDGTPWLIDMAESKSSYHSPDLIKI